MQDRKFFTSMAAALFFMAGITTSCVNDDVLNQDSFDGRTPINFTSSVASRTTNQAIQETQIKEGNTVGVFIANVAETEAGETAEQIATTGSLPTDNQVLTAGASGNLTSTNPIYFPEGASSVDIYAYAPYKADFSNKLDNNVTFAVASDQSEEAGYIASDFMIAQNKNVATDKSDVSLTFDHKMVKLNLNFKVSEADKANFQGATVTVSGVKTAATVNISTGAVTATETVVDITAAKFAADAGTFTASVIFVPQAVKPGQLKVTVTKGDQTPQYEAVLNQNIEFKGGVRYIYNVEIQNGKLVLNPTTSINGWEDTVISPYNVGDYVLADGTIVSKDNYTTQSDNTVKAIIFSTQVSETDAQNGYVAYAMGVEIQSGSNWCTSSSNDDKTGKAFSEEEIMTYAQAIADLDGLTKTTKISSTLSSSYSTYYENSIFKKCSQLTGISGNFSEWFVPSMGQIFQMLNNIGGGSFTGNDSEIIAPTANSSPMYYTNENDKVITDINSVVANASAVNDFINLSTQAVYATSSEYMDNFWCLQTQAGVSNATYNWAFGRNPGKYGTSNNRSFIPCIAIKLPTNTSETTAGN